MPANTFVHPELRQGEVLLINCSQIKPDEFDQIDYQTKRAGQIAYDDKGRVLQGSFPVFVSIAEYRIKNTEVKIGQ